MICKQWRRAAVLGFLKIMLGALGRWTLPRISRWRAPVLGVPSSYLKVPNEHRRPFRSKAHETGDRKCPVSCIKEFVNRRPTVAKSPESPFFLAFRHRRKPDQLWFLNNPMGKNKIGKFLSKATKDLPLSRSCKYTNHSVRKTSIKTLLDSGVSHSSVAQLSGHKSLKSLDSYAVASHQQQRHMSKILSWKQESEPKPNPN